MIDGIEQLVKDVFKNDFTGHDYNHTFRVCKMACHLASFDDCNLEVVELASMLHDVDDRKMFDSYKELTNAKRIMNILNIDSSTKKQVIDIINEVSFKGSDAKVPSTIEGKIVQDADRLDAIGAIGIARCLSYGAKKNRVLYDPNIKPCLNLKEDEYYQHQNTTINHFYEKLLLLKDMMNTKEARRIAIKRDKILREYLKEFLDEWNF